MLVIDSAPTKIATGMRNKIAMNRKLGASAVCCVPRGSSEMPIEMASTNGMARNLAISRLLINDRKSFWIMADSAAPINGT